MNTQTISSASSEAPSASDWTAVGAAVGAAIWPLWQDAFDYSVDTWQRTILFADVLRQRGNQYREHMAQEMPHVLDFEAEVVLDGLDLARPVNYGLVRIQPDAEQPTDPHKRPFVIVDPRAGHGPGIGGFKADSEIGVALAAGHPCYFVGFGPEPAPGQTMDDVIHATAAFVEKAGSLHPGQAGKPVVIGNCQAGWQVLMAAAIRPELFGPILVAGAPLSFWAGWRGRNPMRYSGGLLGGSWLTALTSDLGNGHFDGAWLVQNFENLDPAHTHWRKSYHLHANIDTEATRYLGFEKYWGGHVFLNATEIQWIVDKLFIGNSLSTAQLDMADGSRIDLRNIRSPIVVFCSQGDNITPPPQALGWLHDLYQDDADLIGHDQTIVYAVHERIGHLGIFVSSSVAQREHRTFASTIDLIDLLPAGLYEAGIKDTREADWGRELLGHAQQLSIQPRSLDDVRSIVQPDPESDRAFAAAERISRINLGLYRQFMQPAVRGMATPQTAQWLRQLHPQRMRYEAWSDQHPLAPVVATLAEQIREQRRPVSSDNAFLTWQQATSDWIETWLDGWRVLRDHAIAEPLFDMLYRSPWIQAITGIAAAEDEPARPHPGISAEHRAFVQQEMARLQGRLHEGGLVEANTRALFHLLQHQGEADERHFNMAEQLLAAHGGDQLTAEAFRQLVREQSLLLRIAGEEAIAAIASLLRGEKAEDIRASAMQLARLLEPENHRRENARGQLQQDLQLQDILDIYEMVASQTDAQAIASPVEPSEAPIAVARKQAATTKRKRNA